MHSTLYYNGILKLKKRCILGVALILHVFGLCINEKNNKIMLLAIDVPTLLEYQMHECMCALNYNFLKTRKGMKSMGL